MKHLEMLASASAVRPIATQVLASSFAQAFGVQPPCVIRPGIIAQDRNPQTAPTSSKRPDLWAFREFSAACMEEALSSAEFAASCEKALYERAFLLGSRIRAILAPREDELGALVRLLYSLIEIDVKACAGNSLAFKRCYFSGGYAPRTCAFMAHFDSGFVAGICGGGRLEFSARMTQGDPCCIALLKPNGGGR